jgi:hypothetical protein
MACASISIGSIIHFNLQQKVVAWVDSAARREKCLKIHKKFIGEFHRHKSSRYAQSSVHKQFLHLLFV